MRGAGGLGEVARAAARRTSSSARIRAVTATPLVGMVLLTAHLAAVWFCVGLVWIVQVLVYPGFAAVGARVAPDVWRAHHDRHTRAMGLIVTVPWAVQGLTCAILLVARPPGVPFLLAAAAGVCGAATVAVTVGVSVPCHRSLSTGYDPAVLERLVTTNWWRTTAWTVGGVVAVAMGLRPM